MAYKIGRGDEGGVEGVTVNACGEGGREGVNVVGITGGIGGRFSLFSMGFWSGGGEIERIWGESSKEGGGEGIDFVGAAGGI